MHFNMVVRCLQVTCCNIADKNIHLSKHNEKKGSMFVVTCFLSYRYDLNEIRFLWFYLGLNTFPRVKLLFELYIVSTSSRQVGKLYQ